MNPDAPSLWRGPRWALAILLAVLGMVGPFSIDTYLPAFTGMAQSLGATPVQMQQTLSAYLFGFSFMSLFHGAISDSFGRRPVVLCGMAVFTLASVGCALSPSIGHLVFFRVLQGLSTGAGIVVARTVVRDIYPPSQAQKMMSQITIFFGIAPAIAPLIGGWLFVWLGWRSIFWFLAAGRRGLVDFQLPVICRRRCRWTQRQSFRVGNLMRGYWQLGLDPRFVLLALAAGLPFNGNFIYVLAAPAFLGEHLGLAPTQFFWFFVLNIGGIMAGAWLSGRLAGQISARAQIRIGFTIMVGGGPGQPDGQHAADRAGILGHAAADVLRLWLGLNGARGHLAGARLAPGTSGHGVVVADVRRLRCQCHHGGGDRTVGHAFHPGDGDGVDQHARHRPGGMGRCTTTLAGDRPHSHFAKLRSG